MKKFVPLILAAVMLSGCTSNAQKTQEGENQDTQQTEISESAFGQDAEEEMYVEQPPEFLSDENKELFKKAENIYFNVFVSTGFNMTGSMDNETTDFEGSENVSVAFESEYMYSDFENYIESIFSGDALEAVNKGAETLYHETSDGKLCWVDAGRGTNISYKEKRFELVNESEDKIEFKAVADYSWEGIYESEEEFKESGMDGEYNWSEEYNFELTKTEDGWRISHFEYWK